MSLLLFFAVTGEQVTPPPPTPAPPPISTGAASYPSDYRLTQRLTMSQWLKLIYGPEGPTVEQLSNKKLQQFLEDDDLTALMLL